MRIHVKSQYGADFRRYSIVVGTGLPLPMLEEFLTELFKIHKLSPEQSQAVTVSYADRDGSNLPISNDDNLHKALGDKPNLLRINLQNKGESYEEQFGYGLTNKSIDEKKKRTLSISSPQEFRRVSSILDADTLPTELRRVQLCKAYTNKPLGFYIRTGENYINTFHGTVITSGIFISRLLPHGLAASTNILNVDDEILEVNGICLKNKSLDQVTDVMLANATNLILTTRPAAPMSPMHFYNSLPPPYSMPGHGYHMMHYPTMHYSPVISPRHPGYPGHYMAHLQPHNLYNQENLDDKYRNSSPVAQFSRESTYRLSDKTAKLTLNSTRTPPRRPMSVHPGWTYLNYGMGY